MEQEERRRTRIQILRDLIEDLTTYPAYPANFAPLQGDSGQMNELQLRLSALHEKSLGGVIEDLKVVLTVEEQLASEVLAFGLPNSRPVGWKNHSAKRIHDVLVRNQVDAWTACGVIAEMFAQAGLGSGDLKKDQRAIHDRVRSGK